LASIGLSEFSFGFAFLYERTVIEAENLVSFPVLPNLREEAEVGWDAHLPLEGLDVYYQFKLSEYMSRANSYERTHDPHLDGAYFRYDLHPNDNYRQHRLLWALGQTTPDVFYVSPEVTALADFTEAFLSRRVQGVSRLVPLSECRNIEADDSDRHRIMYQPGTPGFIMTSVPKRGLSRLGKDLWSQYAADKPRWRRIDRSFATEVLDRVEESVSRIAPQLLGSADLPSLGKARRRGMTTRAYLGDASHLLHTLLGAQLVLIGSRG
jgi:hypothetical protein